MTTRKTLSDSASLRASAKAMASKALQQGHALPARSSDKQGKASTAQRSNSDELDLDAYISEQDPVTQRAVAEEGAWVADTFYPGDETLATLRLRSGLSQKEFAALCGIRQPHVSRYESGKHEPGLLQADRMARVLGVTLERLAQAVRRSTNKLTA